MGVHVHYSRLSTPKLPARKKNIPLVFAQLNLYEYLFREFAYGCLIRLTILKNSAAGNKSRDLFGGKCFMGGGVYGQRFRF